MPGGEQVRGVGKRGGTASLFKLGDELIHVTALHKLLATSVPEMMPVVVTDLLVTSPSKKGLGALPAESILI